MWPPPVATATGCIHTVAPGVEIEGWKKKKATQGCGERLSGMRWSQKKGEKERESEGNKGQRKGEKRREKDKRI